jgi:hypothetical protein
MANQTERSELREYVAAALRDEARWTRARSALHHCFLFGAAILRGRCRSYATAQNPRSCRAKSCGLGTVFATLASLIGVISVSGGFARRWRANRMTKAALEQIEIDLMDPNCDPGKIRAELAEMKRIHHLAIVGDEEPAKPNKQTAPNP